MPTPQSTKQERLKFLRDRTLAHQIIRQSVEPVIDILFGYGWEDGKDNPQGLYNTVLKAVSRVTDESWYQTVWDLTSLNAANFNNLYTFLTYYNKYIKKLRDVGLEFPDRAKQVFLLKGLKNYDESWTNVLQYNLQIGDLTYEKLI